MSFSVENKFDRMDKSIVANQSKVAQGTLLKYILLRHKVTRLLQNKFEQLSTSGKKHVVIVFCLISLSMSVYLILKSFNKNQRSSFSITPISISTETFLSKRGTVVSFDKFKEIERFKRYIDSLSKRQSGKKIPDSIAIVDRRLIDSLSFIENLYHLKSAK